MVEGIPRFFQTRFLRKSFVLKFIEGFDLRKEKGDLFSAVSPGRKTKLNPYSLRSAFA